MKIIVNLFLNIYILKYVLSSNNITEICKGLCSIEGGECFNNNKCKCKSGFTTLFIEDNIVLCNYKRYNRITVGFIELFFGFGFGHFYCKRYLNGYIQLFIEFISYCLMACLFGYFLLYDSHFNLFFPLTNSFLKFYFPLWVISIFSWQIIDSLLFFGGFYQDGNNVDLI